MRVAAPILVLLLTVSVASGARGAPAGGDGGAYYQSTDGTLVHGPTHKESAEFGPVTAACRDQRASYAHARRGACTRHDGVSAWRQ